VHGKLPISKKTNLWNTDIDSKIITHTRLFLFQILVFTLFLISKLSLHYPLRKEAKQIKKKTWAWLSQKEPIGFARKTIDISWNIFNNHSLSWKAHVFKHHWKNIKFELGPARGCFEITRKCSWNVSRKATFHAQKDQTNVKAISLLVAQLACS